MFLRDPHQRSERKRADGNIRDKIWVLHKSLAIMIERHKTIFILSFKYPDSYWRKVYKDSNERLKAVVNHYDKTSITQYLRGIVCN